MERDDLEILYQETILDHYKNPRGVKKCEQCTSEKEGYNPLCGDKVDMAVEISN
ncbi:MAG: iron-sulfur cluster assembly scaffold protein, partial [bacterium]|nr:iron-sulfur cluster assembly scaffold protein [bacterium]